MRWLGLSLLILLPACSLLFDGSDLHGNADAHFSDDLSMGNGDGSSPMDLTGGGGDGGGGDGGVFTLSFAAATHYPFADTNGQNYGMVTGDINGDGKLDILIANGAENKLGVLLGKGDGTFAQTVASYDACPLPNTNSPNGLAVGDFDNNGKLDVAVACDPSSSLEGAVYVMINSGNNTAMEPTFSSGRLSWSSSVLAVQIADIDHDGFLDVVASDRDVPPGVADPNASYVTVLWGLSGGNFSGFNHFSTGHANGYRAVSLAVADYNGDGKLDVAGLFDSDAQVSILINSGGPKSTIFNTVISTSDSGPSPNAIIPAALNGAKLDDLVVTNYDSFAGTSRIGVLLDTYVSGPIVDGGVFGSPKPFPTDVFPLEPRIGDFNKDGKPDVAVGCYVDTADPVLAGSKVDVLLGDGTGNFGGKVGIGTVPFPAHYTTVADFNKDGLDDVAIGSSNSQNGGYEVYVFLNTSH